jgi:hypothetical protein
MDRLPTKMPAAILPWRCQPNLRPNLRNLCGSFETNTTAHGSTTVPQPARRLPGAVFRRGDAGVARVLVAAPGEGAMESIFRPPGSSSIG